MPSWSDSLPARRQVVDESILPNLEADAKVALAGLADGLGLNVFSLAGVRVFFVPNSTLAGSLLLLLLLVVLLPNTAGTGEGALVDILFFFLPLSC